MSSIGYRASRLACLTSLLIAILATTLPASASASRTDWQTTQPDFTRHFYIGTGLGFSHLDPDTSEVEEDVDDRVNAAGQITVGVDVLHWLSAELHSADLGSAGLFPEGRINYHVHGVSALMYFGGDRRSHMRGGLTAFGRTGVGYLHNSGVGRVRYQRDNPVHLLFGAGVEYMSRIGLGARAEFYSFDNDAVYGQLSLVYRFGGTHKRPPVQIAAKEPVAIAPVAAISVVSPDTDNDKVTDAVDQCPDTTKGVSVDASGCALFEGVADGVNFYTNSASLTPLARTTLDDIAGTLHQHGEVRATISAHTDDWGESEYNQRLSERRAQSVVDYLARQGVERRRLDIQAFGETKPIATNKTAEGRERNRRVEITAVPAHPDFAE